MRDQKIDFYKGMLMIGVIWGHAINAYHFEDYTCLLHRFFRTYDMPFFMLLSGVFLAVSMQKYDLKKLLLNKFTTLLLPVVVWNLIRSHHISLGGYYFVGAVFYSAVIIIVSNILTKYRFVRGVLYLLPILALHCINSSLNNLAYLYPFFLTGYLFFDTSISLKHAHTDYQLIKIRKGVGKHADMAVILLFVTAMCFWEGEYTPWKTGFNALADYTLIPIMVYRFLLGLIGIFVMKWVFDRLYQQISITPFICKIGKETLGVYFIQGILVEYIFDTGMYVLDSHYQIRQYYYTPVMCYVLAPLIALTTCWVSLVLIGYIKRYKYTKWILGFKIAK